MALACSIVVVALALATTHALATNIAIGIAFEGGIDPSRKIVSPRRERMLLYRTQVTFF